MRTRNVRMAKLARNAFHTSVNAVAEVDRLLGSDGHLRIIVHEIKHHPKDRGCQYEKEILFPSAPLHLIRFLVLDPVCHIALDHAPP